MKTIKTFKLKHFIGSIILAVIAIFSAIHPEKYHILIPIFFGALAIISAGVLLAFRKDIFRYAVLDNDRKVLKSFTSEDKALEFADSQNKETKVVMLNIKQK